MSQFQATKCDECGRIQGEANHWVQIQAWFLWTRDITSDDLVRSNCQGVALGAIVGFVMGTSNFTTAKPETRDLCGQGCAVKHIARLLKWNLPEDK